MGLTIYGPFASSRARGVPDPGKCDDLADHVPLRTSCGARAADELSGGVQVRIRINRDEVDRVPGEPEVDARVVSQPLRLTARSRTWR